MSTLVRSYSKINLGLAIGPVRPDGFHGLTTLYQALELHDLVTVEAVRAAGTRISLTSNDGRVPTDSRNTCWKMVERALENNSKPMDPTWVPHVNGSTFRQRIRAEGSEKPCS